MFATKKTLHEVSALALAMFGLVGCGGASGSSPSRIAPASSAQPETPIAVPQQPGPAFESGASPDFSAPSPEIPPPVVPSAPPPIVVTPAPRWIAAGSTFTARARLGV